MKVARLPFRSPLLCIDDFLSEEEAQRVLQECINLKKLYVPAKVYDGPTATKVNPRFRTNEVVNLNEVYRGTPERSDILRVMKKKIRTQECRELWHEGYSIFDIINYSTRHEAVISRYGETDFFKEHRDTRDDHLAFRLVTLVYYVNRTPAQFTGGSLVLWEDSGESIKVEPKHNRAVLFPSFALHEVESVRMNSENWEDGRFSLNYWMGFR